MMPSFYLFLCPRSWAMTSTLSAACSDTSHGLGPLSPIPSPSHTLPVNHSNFIDITGITDETLSVSQFGACVGPQSFCMYTDVHVHKYTVTPLPPLRFPLWLSYPPTNIRENGITADTEVCACVTGSQQAWRDSWTSVSRPPGVNVTFLALFKQSKGEVKMKSTLTTFLHQLMALQQHSEI